MALRKRTSPPSSSWCSLSRWPNVAKSIGFFILSQSYDLFKVSDQMLVIVKILSNSQVFISWTVLIWDCVSMFGQCEYFHNCFLKAMSLGKFIFLQFLSWNFSIWTSVLRHLFVNLTNMVSIQTFLLQIYCGPSLRRLWQVKIKV